MRWAPTGRSCQPLSVLQTQITSLKLGLRRIGEARFSSVCSQSTVTHDGNSVSDDFSACDERLARDGGTKNQSGRTHARQLYRFVDSATAGDRIGVAHSWRSDTIVLRLLASSRSQTYRSERLIFCAYMKYGEARKFLTVDYHPQEKTCVL